MPRRDEESHTTTVAALARFFPCCFLGKDAPSVSDATKPFFCYSSSRTTFWLQFARRGLSSAEAYPPFERGS